MCLHPFLHVLVMSIYCILVSFGLLITTDHEKSLYICVKCIEFISYTPRDDMWEKTSQRIL